MGSDATGLESWNRRIGNRGKHWKVEGKHGEVTRRKTKMKITFRQTKVSLSDRKFQTNNSNSYRTGAKNVSALNAGPGEAL